MFSIIRLIIIFYSLISSGFYTSTANNYNCHLPEGCRFEKGFVQLNFDISEIGDKLDIFVMMCDINNNEFTFKFKDPPTFVTNQKCIIDSPLIFRWTSKVSTILDKQFNFTNVFGYLSYMYYSSDVYLWSLKGIDLDFMGENPIDYTGIYYLELSNCRLDFYQEKKRINSCDDIIKLNKTSIRSIFQLKLEIDDENVFVLRSVEYKQAICPLVFNNSHIVRFVLIDLVDTFYKRNVLSFSNETSFTNLKSNIQSLQLHKIQNINLDLKLVHPSVFSQTRKIRILSGSLNSIDGEMFRNLNKLSYFEINPIMLRKINHKQGIEWIRQWNVGVNVGFKSNKTYMAYSKELRLYALERKRMTVIFPDEDFCIYVDFPFNQFVILYEKTIKGINYNYNENELSCSYLWLVQYYEDYYKYYLESKNGFVLKALMRVLNTTAFKSMSKCNFKERIGLCNKSNYQVKNNWDESDIFILGKKMQTAFKIMLYPTAFLGLITNIIVVVVIVIKENSDLFKGIKHYNYLYLNSIFCIIIMVIELFSWMTECFYPFEVFCPETRKLVPIQFFKIIFKECLITLLRFMCSFTYVAFALNRISLIGKDHGKLVKFFSGLGIKVFIGVTILISSSLSWIKGFKYEVNYFFPFLNYPMSTEMDITIIKSNTFNDAYFIINFICDLCNYVVFVIICVIIDICMVVQLRQILDEKTKKSESMNQNQNNSKKAENEKVVNKAIKMVVLNSAIGILFKLPASFIPLLNVVAEFYYKKEIYKFNHPNFGEFYIMLHNTQLNSLIQDISYFLYTLSLSIQIFIYIRFDKKFQIGFERIKEMFFSYIKSHF